MKKICCFFNYPPHYRYAIYNAMDKTFNCEFYFGDNVFIPLKSFDVHCLEGFKAYLNARITNFKGYIWHKGAMKLFNPSYTHYIVTGEPSIIANWMLILWCKITGKKLIMWTHGIHQTYNKKSNVVVYKLFYRSADILLMYSSYNLKYMENLGCKTEKIRYIHNSLDTKVQTSIYKNIQKSNIYTNYFNNENPVVIYIGRLQKRKKIEQIIEAVDLLNSKNVSINIVLVGNNVDDDYLRTIVKSKGLERNTWFFGASYDETKNSELLFNASVCVCPAAIGLTAIHSLSYGCPVISNDNLETQMPECECIVEGVTGSFFKEDNINDLAKKIDYWCNISPSKREITRREARKLITQQWSIDYQIETLKEIIE